MVEEFGTKCLVLGDIALDRYIYGDVERISPEAPIPVIKVTGRNTFLGMAANVAMNIKNLGVEVILFGTIGDDTSGHEVQKLLDESGIDFKGLITGKTTTKTRIVGKNQQMLRVDEEENDCISHSEEECLLAEIKSALKNVQVLLISDYNKGVCTDNLCRLVIKSARDSGKTVIIDPKSSDWEKYSHANIVTPNFREFREMWNENALVENTVEGIKHKARSVIKKYELESILVTRSEKGMVSVDKNNVVLDFSSQAREVFDVSGAGDTVVAALAAFTAKGFNNKTALEYANAAAGIVIGKFGTSCVSLTELTDYFENENMNVKKKIASFDDAMALISNWKNKKEKIIFTNGCFDILHSGHIHYLNEASKIGDKLIIGLNTDQSVKRLKGESRPINYQTDRALMLAALSFVDLVILFDEDTPIELIKTIEPDVLVKGGDYKPEEVVGREYADELVLIPFVDGFSTTNIIQKMKEA